MSDSRETIPYADWLFATLLGTAVLSILVRWQIVSCTPQLRPFFAAALYQDVIMLVLLAWIFHALFRVANGRRATLAVAVTGCALCLAIAIYAAVTVIVYNIIRSPITYRLFALSGFGHGIEASVSANVSEASRAIPASLFVVLTIALALMRLFPGAVSRMRSAFHQPAVLAIVVLYAAGAHAVSTRFIWFPNAVVNPEWAFLDSLLETSRPDTQAPIPAQYFDDFRPARQASSDSAMTPVFATPPRQLNVILFVMESVGQRQLQLYRALTEKTPQFVSLSPHSLEFGGIYASQANSSSAIAALFCSLYPEHAWLPVVREHPGLEVPGLPAFLVKRGYRTAFMYPGRLELDNDKEFLQSHGFQLVSTRTHDTDTPVDDSLLPQAINWINQDRSKPFFLTIWTRNTHHPYASQFNHRYTPQDNLLNRYLNAIRSDDELLGGIYRKLTQMKLAGDTLLVITGDHGEAFGEHGWMVHGFTTYDEEVRVPLLFVNPNLFQERVEIDRTGRQIDIAPTILRLLGYQPPAQWQGADLLSGGPPRRAYLFSANGGFNFAVVDYPFKYIYDRDAGGSQLYDLRADPMEKTNRIKDRKLASVAEAERLRIGAWLSFQNAYLQMLASGRRAENWR